MTRARGVDTVENVKQAQAVEKPRVVMIAYFFPPDGNAAVYRPLRFVRHLSASHWAPTVVTVDGSSHERFDPQLLKTVPDTVGIKRVAGRDVWQAIQAWRARRLQAQITGGAAEHVAKVYQSQQRPWRRWARNVVRTIEASVYYPDHARFWIRAATAATVAVCHQTRPAVIVATGGPWSSFLVARAASRRTGVPYVLDFRDSWTLTCNDDFEARRPRWAARQDRQVLSRLFRDAQAVIFRYDTEAECYWRAYQGTLSVDRIHIIPNGYEGALETSPPPPGDRCTVLYAGTVTPYRYDTFLDALSLLRADHPAEASRLRVLFVGEGGTAMAEAAAKRGLDDVIATMKPVPLHEVERLQQEAHALLLLGVKPYQGYELCGSKVFGYLKASRPILGVLPNDETRKVLERVGVTTIADIESPPAIVATIRRILESWSTHQLSALLPDVDACRWYSAESQTAALIPALEGAPPINRFTPGIVNIPPSLHGKIGMNGWIAEQS